ncbi:MAG: hypothetical protein E3K32_03490 [wastewater metagenome]|nr:hypothetical protein [Candidatus Loosdrechtia aerotolerans]
MSNPMFFQKGKEEITNIKARVSSLERELAEAYQRWESLEKIQDIVTF